MTVRILVGDCRAMLDTLPERSVQTCVTSPPYFGLRDYGVAGQIGLEATPDAYVAEMVQLFRGVRRVLRDDGTVFLNLGDSYYSTSAGGAQGATGQRAGRRFTGTGLGARRANACGTSGKEPEGSRSSDCLCGSLCDACRAAYRLGKSHSGIPPVPMPDASPSESILVRTGSECAHPPTSGCAPQADRSADATPGSATTPARAVEPPRVSRESTTHGCARPSDGSRSPASNQGGVCQLCARSFARCVPASADTTACTCGTETPSGASTRRMSGTPSSDSAYRNITTTSLKSKDLIGVPWRVAFALQADGWYLRSDIVWAKPNPMPESVTDRPTKAHEYVFLLSKAERYVYDAAAIAEDASGTEARPQRRRALEIAARSGLTDAHIAAVRSVGVTDAGKAQLTQDGYGKNAPDVIALAAEAKSALGGYYREFLMAPTKNARSVWSIATQPFAGAHFATMPPALAERCIRAGSRPGDTVLDPFGGAGTTGLVADRLGRDAVLVELNPTYAALAEQRIRSDAGLFADVDGAA